MKSCAKNGHRLGRWDILDATTQVRRCIECGWVGVSAQIPPFSLQDVKPCPSEFLEALDKNMRDILA